MMKTLTLTSAMAIVLIAGHASAQEVTYGAGSLSAGYIDVDGNELQAFTLDGDIEVTHNQFVFGGSAKHQSLEQGSDSQGISNYDAFAAYTPNTQLMFGAGLTGIAVEDNDTYSGHEVFAQYETGGFSSAVAYERPLGNDDDLEITSVYGQVDVSPDVTVGAVIESVSEFDEKIYYLSADYAAGPIEARGYFHGVTDVDASVYGARGTYDFAQGYFGSAGVQLSDGFFGEEFTVYSVGGGYQLNDMAAIDASVGQLIGTDDEATVFRVGLTFELGERKRLDNAMADAIRADLAGGLGEFFPDYGFGNGISYY